MKRASYSLAGLTLAEVLITILILSGLIFIVPRMINMTQRGFSTAEINTSLKVTGQWAMNRMSTQLAQNKRFFDKTTETNGQQYALGFDIALRPVTATSKLCTIEATKGLSPSSATTYAGALSVGNALLFASYAKPVDYLVSGVTMRVDLYVFNYYYLVRRPATPQGLWRIGGQQAIDLRELRTIRYADYTQLSELVVSTPTLATTVLTNLYNDNIRFAWKTSHPTYGNSIYNILPGGSLSVSPVVGHTLQVPPENNRSLLTVPTGMAGTTYRYGISPNTTPSMGMRNQVPKFYDQLPAPLPSDLFPSGFEILCVGPDASRQVLIRMVLVGQGVRGVIDSEEISITNVRDVWK